MKHLFLLLLCITSFAFAQDQIIFSPYGDNAIDSTDENSSVGTPLFRVSLSTNTAITEDQIVLSDSVSFAATTDTSGSVWITNARKFDYETIADLSIPLTVTVGSVSKTIVMTILPKNDNPLVIDWEKSQSMHPIIAEDSTLILNLRNHFSISDADLPEDKNSWTISIQKVPNHCVFSYDSTTETATITPNAAAVEFDPNKPDSLVIALTDRNSADLDNTTMTIDSISIYFHITNTNDEPVVAYDDTLNVDEKGIVQVTSQDNKSLLNNDYDLDNEFHLDSAGNIRTTFPLTAMLISESVSSKGELQVATTGAFAYRHHSGSGSDIFQYEVTDGISKDTATVLVQITLLNDNSPETSFDTLFVPQGGTVSMFRDSSVTLFDKVSDQDLPNDVISILQEEKSTVTGTVSISATGTFSYSHNNERIFSDYFTVQVEDEAGHSVIDTIHIAVSPVIPGALSVEMIPLNGVVPSRFFFPVNMVNSCTPQPYFANGTVCDIVFSRPILDSDLQIDLTIIDVVGNVVSESSFPSGNTPYFLITRTESDKRIRIFWEAINQSGRVVGSDTYLLEAVITDTYTGEVIKQQTNWGLMSDLNLIGQ